jgi:hypothetical protein
MMSRFLRSIPVLALLIAMLVAAAWPFAAAAQEGEVAAAQASPETAQETATGILQVIAVTCEAAEGVDSVAIYLGEEFAPGETCYDGSAGVLVDGVDYGAAAPVLEVELAAAPYAVTDAVSGVSRQADVFAETVTTVWIVTTTVVVPEPEVADEPEPAAVTNLALVVHVCDPDIQTQDALLALGGRYARLGECPVLTLPGEYAPDGTVTAGQEWFDVAIQNADGFSASIANAVFQPDAVCESSTGVALNSIPWDDACFSTSRYAVEVPMTGLGISLTAVPALHRFGYAEAGDDSYAGAVGAGDPSSGYFEVDASAGAADPIVAHVYLLAPPRVTIVQHLCGPDVASAEVLEALGGFVARALACPAVDRSGLDFDVTIADGAGTSHALSNVAPEAWSVCEIELGFDFNGDASDNACLDMPAYRVVNVARGAVELWQTIASAGYAPGGIDFVPGTNDGATFLGFDPAQGLVALDTSGDGDVVVHLYAIPVAQEEEPEEEPEGPAETPTPVPTATATPPQEPSGAGTLQVVALYCLGNRNQTTLTALAPGQQATEAVIGGSCFGGDASMRVSLADGSPHSAFRLGSDGQEWVEDLPVTGDSGPLHTLSDQVSGQSASFAIASDAVTRVILRVEAALSTGQPADSTGESSGNGNAPGNGDDPGGQAVDPLDLLNNLVTDVLVTDDLTGIPDGGTMTEGSYDANAFVVDLLAGLDAEEVAGVTVDGMPVVGAGDRSPERLPGVAILLVAAAALLIGLLSRSFRRASDGLQSD